MNTSEKELRDEMAAAIFHFLESYEEDPDRAIDLADAVLLLENVAEARAELLERAIENLKSAGMSRTKHHSIAEIRDWAMTLGRLGVTRAIEDGKLTPAQIHDVLVNPEGIRIASKSFLDIDGTFVDSELDDSTTSLKVEPASSSQESQRYELVSAKPLDQLAAASPRTQQKPATHDKPGYRCSEKRFSLEFPNSELGDVGQLVVIEIRRKNARVAIGIAALHHNESNQCVFAEEKYSTLQLLEGFEAAEYEGFTIGYDLSAELLRLVAQDFPAQLKKLKEAKLYSASSERSQAYREAVDSLEN